MQMTNIYINKITKELKAPPGILFKEKRISSVTRNNSYPDNRMQRVKLKGIRRKDPEVTHYQFTGEITIYTVNKLKTILIRDLRDAIKLEFDLGNIDKFDSAGFQLFIYLDREANNAGKLIQIITKSRDVSGVFILFGVDM
jgi:ABC-type transporter Mla MlaB component